MFRIHTWFADLLNAVEARKPRKRGVAVPCYIAEGVDIPDEAYIGAFAYIGEECVSVKV